MEYKGITISDEDEDFDFTEDELHQLKSDHLLMPDDWIFKEIEQYVLNEALNLWNSLTYDRLKEPEYYFNPYQNNNLRRILFEFKNDIRVRNQVLKIKPNYSVYIPDSILNVWINQLVWHKVKHPQIDKEVEGIIYSKLTIKGWNTNSIDGELMNDIIFIVADMVKRKYKVIE